MSPKPLSALAERIVESYESDSRGQFLNRRFLPNRQAIITIVEDFLALLYPGYFGRQDLHRDNVGAHVLILLEKLRAELTHQIEQCLCHEAEVRHEPSVCRSHAERLADALLEDVPELRSQLIEDVQAAVDGDPAATSLHEIILAYPGLLAITVYRIAHRLHGLGVPLLPRIMTEWAHSQTGCDIHPGATVGRAFFIDHATGVVVGETSQIGHSVKLYQGVTLGALSLPKDEKGVVIREARRHPTVEDGVTIYANATVLGGRTTLGKGSVVGGSVFLTKSIPAGARVALKPPELSVKTLEPQWIEYEI